MIGSLPQQRMDEIAGSESAGDEGGNPFAIGRLHSYLIADVRKYLLVTHANKRQLAEVRMC